MNTELQNDIASLRTKNRTAIEINLHKLYELKIEQQKNYKELTEENEKRNARLYLLTCINELTENIARIFCDTPDKAECELTFLKDLAEDHFDTKRLHITKLTDKFKKIHEDQMKQLENNLKTD